MSRSTIQQRPSGYRVVHRPARALPAAPAAGTRALPQLPAAPAAPGAGQTAMQALLPVMGGLGMVLFVVANGNPVFLLAGVVMVAATLGGAAALLAGQRSGARRHTRVARERYLAHLEGEREELRDAGRQQADLAAVLHPHPGALRGLIAEPGRLWPRRPGDPDFLQLRVGLGTVRRAEAREILSSINWRMRASRAAFEVPPRTTATMCFSSRRTARRSSPAGRRIPAEGTSAGSFTAP